MIVPPVLRQEQLIEEIALHLADEVEGDWSTLVFNHRNLSMFFTGRIDVHRPDGSFAHAKPPDSVLTLTDELRRVMYEPDKGAWFSARWTIASREGEEDGVTRNSTTVVFNYDDEPVWRWPAHPGLYAIDLETFPRAAEHVPTWLRQKVSGAQRTL
ncbi:agglutinin cell wall attachment protein [Nocardioides sp. CCNWLW239]|uniref:agglutinin cell wall attachment protein n=1 Tax=Nocardioides sp. CCNWLW239 TaxID=3128902 RepID=UPI0030170A2D